MFAICGVSAACGGRVQVDGRTSPASNAGGASGSSGAPSVAGTWSDGGAAGRAGGGAALPDGGAGVPPTPLGCSAPTDESACTSATVLLDLHHVTSDPASGLSVEPLQAPDYGVRPDDHVPSYIQPDPSAWDRSTRPAGACVFRLHGMSASCLSRGLLFEGGCPAPGDPGVAPQSFYESPFCKQALVPGCPISDPWGIVGAWWYLQNDGADVDLVVCAPGCEVAIAGPGGACLSFNAPSK